MSLRLKLNKNLREHAPAWRDENLPCHDRRNLPEPMPNMQTPQTCTGTRLAKPREAGEVMGPAANQDLNETLTNTLPFGREAPGDVGVPLRFQVTDFAQRVP